MQVCIHNYHPCTCSQSAELALYRRTYQTVRKRTERNRHMAATTHGRNMVQTMQTYKPAINHYPAIHPLSLKMVGGIVHPDLTKHTKDECIVFLQDGASAGVQMTVLISLRSCTKKHHRVTPGDRYTVNAIMENATTSKWLMNP